MGIPRQHAFMFWTPAAERRQLLEVDIELTIETALFKQVQAINQVGQIRRQVDTENKIVDIDVETPIRCHDPMIVHAGGDCRSEFGRDAYGLGA